MDGELSSDASLKTCKCAFCDREFQAARPRNYCSSVCSKRAWTARRSRRRALRHGNRERICPMCGKAFQVSAEHRNQKFCSYACKKLADRESRSQNRLRKDAISLGFVPDALPKELDAMREEKGPEYFKTLFSLEKESQFAEMAKWTEEDHRKALSCLGLRTPVGTEEESVGGDFLNIKAEEKPVFDEEDHFGDV